MTYHWDFFGPRAQGTAEHFKIHLDEFLKAKEIEGWETGTGSQGQGHCEVFCKQGAGGEGGEAGEESEGAKLIKQLLRPKRQS